MSAADNRCFNAGGLVLERLGESGMSSVAVLLLATPIFGLSLQPPTMAGALDLSVHGSPVIAAVVDGDDGVDGDIGGEEEEEDGDSFAAQMKRRNSIAELHRPLGIATWAAMTVAVTLGTIQYYNLYGFFSKLEDTPCVQGDAIFGASQCFGTPWPHAVSAGVTTLLYGTTFTLGALMPDPDNLSEGPGEFASTLRLHKLLRWVHFGGMVLQAVLGIVIANPSTFGMARESDFGTLQALSTVHLASGLVTYGALTWAGALMTF